MLKLGVLLAITVLFLASAPNVAWAGHTTAPWAVGTSAPATGTPSRAADSARVVPAETPEPEPDQTVPTGVEILQRAKEALEPIRTYSLATEMETVFGDESMQLECKGVTEPPFRGFMICEIMGIDFEMVMLDETTAYMRLLGDEIWQEMPPEELGVPAEQTDLGVFGDDTELVDQETIRRVDSYVIESTMDLTEMFDTTPELNSMFEMNESSGSIRAWIGKDDFLPRRFEVDVFFGGMYMEVENHITANWDDFDDPAEIPDPVPYVTHVVLTDVGPVSEIAFSPDGETMAASAEDGTIHLWPTRDPEVNARVLFHPDVSKAREGSGFGADVFYSVAFSPDGEMLAGGGYGEVLLYPLTDQEKEPLSLTPTNYMALHAVAFSPDGSLLAAGGHNGRVYLWDLSQPEETYAILEGHEESVNDLHFLPDGKSLVTAGEDASIRLWDIADLAAEPRILTAHDEPIHSLAVSQNGEYLISAAYMDPVYRWWLEASRTRPERMIPATMPEIGMTSTTAIALAPGDSAFATSDEYGVVRLWAPPEFHWVHTTFITDSYEDEMSLAFSPDGRYLAAGRYYLGTIDFWDLAPDTPLEIHEDPTAADGLTARGVLTRSHEALTALDTLHVTVTMDFSDQYLGQEEEDEPTQVLMFAVDVRLPGDVHGWLDVGLEASKEILQRDGGPMLGRIGPDSGWDEELRPLTEETVLQQGPLAMADPLMLASEPHFAVSETVENDDLYAVAFAVGPKELVEVAPDVDILAGTEWTRVDGLAWIGKHDFLPRRVQYEASQNTPYGEQNVMYVVELDDFDEPVEMPELEEAVRPFVPATDDDDAVAYVDQGDAYRDQGDFDQAIQNYDTAIDLDPEYGDAYFHRGVAYSSFDVYESNDFDQAISDLEKAIELGQNSAEVYYHLGVAIFEGREDFRQALANLEKALDLNPGYAEAYFYRGLQFANLDDLDQAVEDIDRAIALDPTLEHAFYWRGYIYGVMFEDYEQAIRDYGEAIKLNPEYVSAYSDRGYAYARLEEYDDALNSFDEAIRLEPDHINAHQGRAMVGQELGDYGTVARECSTALEASGGYLMPVQLCLSIMAEVSARDFDDAAAAVKSYDQAIARAPDLAVAYLLRGFAKWALGDVEDALHDMETALSMDPLLYIHIFIPLWAEAFDYASDPAVVIEELKAAREFVDTDSPIANSIEGTLKALQSGE